MSSNNDSPSTNSAKRPNKAKKNAAEYQERVLSKVREMFDSILEPDVILSVVQNCNWKLQPSIEHLITLSANVDSPTESNGNMGSCSEDFGDNESTSMDNLGSSQEDDAFEVDTDFTYLNIDDEELQKQKDGFRKFELMRKQSQDFSQGNSPSRLSLNTCAINESPLEAIEDEDIKSKEENMKIDTIKIPDTSNIEKQTKNSCLESYSRDSTYPVFSADEKDSKENLFTCNQNQLPTFSLHGSSQEALKSLRQAPNQVYNIKTEERRKAETESLCGLKVQYRFGGQETSSDDDADVVIEEESSDYNIPNTQTNVCQFLSLSTQSPLKTTKPQIEMINTPSPFSSPANKHKFKENYQSTLSRIKSTIQRGFKIMVILRGLPGSGKSYLARDIVRSTVGGDFSQYIFSTDDFFSKNGRGIYKFDPTKLPEAHTYNQERVLKALREGRSPIIIDNTNTQCWEMKFYAAMAVQYGYFIEVLEPETPWASNLNQLEKRNVHSVSKETLQRMLDRYERNITGAKLLRIFNFSYDPYNMPPQSCSSLPSPSKSKRAPPIDSNKTKTSNKISKPVENLKDYVPSGFANARVVDAIPNPLNENLTALQLAMKTFGGDDDDDELSPKENDQDLIEDKWEDDGISWEDEMLSVEIKKKNSKAFKETLNEDSTCMDDKVLNVNTEADKATYLNLGAIGSERKNVKSLVDYDSDDSDQNENVLSQCWDFTLMLDGRQIHSVGPLSESENADQEKEDENSSEISSNSAISENPMVVDSSSISENPVKSDDSEKSKSPSAELKEAQNILDDKDSPDSGPKSFNTESFEHIDSNSEDLSLDIHEAIDTRGIVESSMNCLISSEEVEKDSETSNTDPQAKVSFGSIMKFIKKSFLGANNDDSKATKVEEVVKYDQQNPKSPETVMDTLTEKLHSPIKEQNSTIKLNYEVGVNISELTMNDTLSKKLSNISQESNNGNTNLACEPQGTFESTRFFQEEFTTLGVDVITNRNETFEHYCSLKKNSSENQSFISAFEAEKVNLIQETSSLKSINSLNDLNFVSPLSKESENKLDVSMIRPAKIKLTGPLARAVLSLDENERLILEEKKLMKSETNNFEKKHVKTKKFDDKSIQYFETIDNINSITWKETPFPTCEIQMSVKAEEPKNVVTSEASTNTNFYDFNVSYVGGTSESEYKLLNTVSRSINEGLILSNLETPPPQKLKLDKSSMTNEVDILLELPSMSGEIEDTEKDVIQGLFDMFPHISRDYVVDVYKNICKSDSHWAIDVLLDGTPSEEILNAKPLKFPIIEDSYLHSSAFRNKRAEKIKQSGNSDFNESDSNSQARKKEKNQVSEDSLALKRHLEDKVMINMSSYHPHILRVKKWKNREPDVPTEEIIEAQARNKDVIQFLNDLNPVEVAPAESLINSEQHLPEEKEESDGEDSSETEETIELSLGWEFIKNLEKEFGDPNFQFPDGLFPVIQVKKSLAEQIHALWMESMQQQIETQQEYLDSMIAKDAEYAKSLEAEEAKALKDSTAPNLSEVMDMEYALAVYKNDLKKQKIRETPLDMASRLTRQMLNEMFPDYNPETLSEILEAHNGNFKETVKNLEADTGQSFSFLNKQNNLMAKVKQQSLVKEDEASVRSSLTTAEVDEKSYDQLTYDEALQIASESKDEVKRQLLLRSENFDKAYAAYRRGNSAVAAYYSEMAKLHSKKMKRASRDAVEAFIAIQTHGLNEGNTLDLHNLFVPEALQALDIFLNHQLTILSRGSKKAIEIFVITGRGARSNNNKSKIKPAVSRRLASRNISFTETNPGCLKVKLHRYNIAST